MTFNGALFLKEQLRSLTIQTRLPDELVVADDGSSDATVELIEEFARKAPFEVRLLSSSDGHHGLLANAERCLQGCRGDVILLCDQDDVWLPGKVARFLQVLEDSGADAVFSDAELVDRDLRPLGRTLWRVEGFDPSEQNLMQQGDPLAVLLRHNVVQAASLGIRRSLLQLASPIPPELSDRIWVHDGWLAFMAAACGRLRAIPESWMLYRQHGRNLIAHYGTPSKIRRDLSLMLLSLLNRVLGGDAVAVFQRGLLARVAQLELVTERLSEGIRSQNDRFDLTVARDRIAATTEHYRRRAGLSVGLRHRLPKIREEWVQGAYRSYSSGWKSLVRDVIQF